MNIRYTQPPPSWHIILCPYIGCTHHTPWCTVLPTLCALIHTTYIGTHHTCLGTQDFTSYMPYAPHALAHTTIHPTWLCTHHRSCFTPHDLLYTTTHHTHPVCLGTYNYSLICLCTHYYTPYSHMGWSCAFSANCQIARNLRIIETCKLV